MRRIRPARLEEAEALSSLCKRSKAHWGYDDVFMAQARPSLTVGVAQIEAGNVWVAEVGDALAGMVALAPLSEPGLVDLDKLFIDPAHIGSGVGRTLLNAAINEARRRGYRRMAILADPNAAKFYERMSARYLDERSSDAIPGRLLPYFELTL